MKRAPVALVLLAVIAGAVWWLSRQDLNERLTTQVTDLLPAEERDPAMRLVRSLATTEHARTLLVLIDGVESTRDRQAVTAIAVDVLENSPLIAEAWPLDGPPLNEAVLERWTNDAISWFWPQWWRKHGRADDAEAIARAAVSDLSRFLEQPESAFWEDAVTTDPFLLVPQSLEALGRGLSAGAPVSADDGPVRLWVRLAVSPFSEEGQTPVFTLLREAEAQVQDVVPGARIRDAGANRIAHASEVAIRGEIARLNILIPLTVALACLLFLRQWKLLGPIALILGTTLVSGAVISLLLFARIHVFTLVIGSILIGVAVDYALHVFLEADSQSSRERLRKVSRPLLVGSLSTIGGFLVLTLADLPMLRQMGVYIASGLLAALMASLFYAARAPIVPNAVRWIDRLSAGPVGKPIALLFLALSPLLLGLFRIEWADDIRALDYPLPAVRAADEAVRRHFEAEANPGYLLLGEDWASVATAAGLLPETNGSLALKGWVTPPAVAREAHAVARQLPMVEAFKDALETEGYAAEAFAPFFEQWQEWTAEPWSNERYESSVSAQLATLPGPAMLLSGADDNLHWWLIRTTEPLTAPPGVALIPLAQLDSLNAVFTRYREEAMRAAGLGLGVIALGLLASYGWRTGAAIVLLPALPSLLVLGSLGWWGQTLNLFHLLGAFLAVCLTIDYTVFALQARRSGRRLPASITLSALTTGTSFGWLATSALPAVAAMGTAVAPAVLLAWVLALGLTARQSASQITAICER